MSDHPLDAATRALMAQETEGAARRVIRALWESRRRWQDKAEEWRRSAADEWEVAKEYREHASAMVDRAEKAEAKNAVLRRALPDQNSHLDQWIDAECLLNTARNDAKEAEHRAQAAEADRAVLVKALFEVYQVLGFDTGGARTGDQMLRHVGVQGNLATPEHLARAKVVEYARWVVEAAKEARKTHDETGEEECAAEAALAKVREVGPWVHRCFSKPHTGDIAWGAHAVWQEVSRALGDKP